MFPKDEVCFCLQPDIYETFIKDIDLRTILKAHLEENLPIAKHENLI